VTQQSGRSYFAEALTLLSRTMPILGINVAIYAAFFLAATLWFGLWAGMGLLLARVAELAAVICFVIALGTGGWAWRMARRYLLYLVQGAHIAAMTEIMCGRQVPAGPGQVGYARGIMKEYFKDVSQLFVLDALVKGAVKSITGTVVNLTRILPLPGDFRKVINLIRMLVNRSLSYVDEAILSYSVARRQPNVWQSAADGVVLYGQRYKPILITTVKVWVLGKIFGFLAFFGFVAAALALGALTGSNMVVLFGFLLAVAGARLVELALYEPFAVAYTIVTFHRETDGMEPDPAWKARIEGMSAKFRELTQKAREFARGRTESVASAPGAAPAPGEAPAEM
jgi:hypothetical protein